MSTSRRLLSFDLWATVWVSVAAVLALGSALSAHAEEWDAVDFVRHDAYQGVKPGDTSGYVSAYTGPFPMRLRGVVLNNTEDWLDPAENYNTTMWNLGGEAEFYVQAVDMPGDTWDDGDLGGTACWMGQNYGNLPWIGEPEINNYQNSDYEGDWPPKWYGQLDGRHLYRPETPFGDADLVRAGDLVEVRARVGLYYKGKMNVNEQHHNDPTYDFEVVILEKGFGLPDPTAIALSEIMDAESSAIFDHTRETGGEHYQSTLVQIQNVTFVDDIEWGRNNWARNGDLKLTDDTGRTLEIHLGLSDSFDTEPAPEGYFNVVGIMDQSSAEGTDGYRLLAMRTSDFSPVPEPTAILLLAAGAATLLIGTWRSRRQKTAVGSHHASR